ncbi:peptidase U32 family protein [Clostridium formicaceticum]|uniref:Peptidase U32 n=1 Tax=Clostridium formicaceticum TaxID=1497 RepID=A0AAC9RK56_9CLOT|nr:U32 family peptidase [Clostridium formicaceticum]AOY77036.1 peptidase U32 [Clostridium formicaceticum]ARE87536.1 putative protease YhbU precursor [Clostridium formicaceticum]
MKKVELLAPAGDLERLKIAVIYGADAVYLGGEIFGLRAAAKNFNLEDLEEGVKFAHQRGVKVFVTTNIIPHNEDLEALPQYLREIEKVGVDGVIVSDPGTFAIIRETVPNVEVHISTQANNTNHSTVTFWHKLGAKRVVLARELSFDEIKEIRKHISNEIELEAFVHGAMCISYSGRCLLSNYMAGRDANRGECAHPCRWNYYLVEEKRPGEYMPIIEDEKGSYIMNSKDLCMIEYIPELIESGINSLKIEGRMKTTYYVATIIRAYRMAIDAYYDNPKEWKCLPEWLREIKKASHRDFTTGFYLDKPDHKEHIYGDKSYIRGYSFIGMIKAYDETTQIATVQQRNRFFSGDDIEIIGPSKEVIKMKIEKMWNEEGEEIEVAPHPKQIVKFKVKHKVEPYYILRRERAEEENEER